MVSKLKPLKDLKAFDGEKETIELSHTKCPHKNILLDKNVIRCSCGAQWHGANIDKLWKIFNSLDN